MEVVTVIALVLGFGVYLTERLLVSRRAERRLTGAVDGLRARLENLESRLEYFKETTEGLREAAVEVRDRVSKIEMRRLG